MTGEKNSSRLTIPNDIGYVSIAGMFVREVAKVAGFAEAEGEGLEAAVREAVENVIQHAFEPHERVTFDIICELISGGVRVRIKEKGLPFDAGLLSAASSEREVESEDSAVGIARMKKLVDEVTFHNLGRDGKETHLVKYRAAGDVSDYFHAQDLEPYQEPTNVRPIRVEQVPVTVRLMKPAEAAEVARCIYRAYGYSYFYEQVYYPDRIVELNKSGRLISAVAVTDDGNVAGHAAILYRDLEAEGAEIGQAVVTPEFRGQGLLTQLAGFLIQEGRSRGLSGLFLGAVTSHTFSQRVGMAQGFRHCGFLLGYAPSDAEFKGIAEEIPQRETFELEYQYLEKPSRLTLYPPPKHDLFVERLFKNLGVSPQIAVPESFRPGFSESDISVKSSATVLIPAGYAAIQIQRYGAKVVAEVGSLLKRLCLNQIEVITLYVSLRDPLTYHFVPEFEKMGFMVTGILPGTACGEALILQCFNNVPISLEKVRLHSDTARQTLDYIRRRYPDRF